ncbi:MAG TPA: hypothetical protein DCL54_13835 [Alphaproteobacteria bacterium]|nr:hypothetical protein [Alphaproteobacteria bacterium]
MSLPAGTTLNADKLSDFLCIPRSMQIWTDAEVWKRLTHGIFFRGKCARDLQALLRIERKELLKHAPAGLNRVPQWLRDLAPVKTGYSSMLGWSVPGGDDMAAFIDNGALPFAKAVTCAFTLHEAAQRLPEQVRARLDVHVPLCAFTLKGITPAAAVAAAAKVPDLGEDRRPHLEKLGRGLGMSHELAEKIGLANGLGAPTLVDLPISTDDMARKASDYLVAKRVGRKKGSAPGRPATGALGRAELFRTVRIENMICKIKKVA